MSRRTRVMSTIEVAEPEEKTEEQQLIDETAELVKEHEEKVATKDRLRKQLGEVQETSEKCIVAPVSDDSRAVTELVHSRALVEIVEARISIVSIRLREIEKSLFSGIQALRKLHNSTVRELMDLLKRSAYWDWADKLDLPSDHYPLDDVCVDRVNANKAIADLEHSLTAHYPPYGEPTDAEYWLREQMLITEKYNLLCASIREHRETIAPDWPKEPPRGPATERESRTPVTAVAVGSGGIKVKDASREYDSTEPEHHYDFSKKG